MFNLVNLLNLVNAIMPELPEVQTVASELNRKLKNRIIESVEINAPKMISIGPQVVSNVRIADKRSAAKFRGLLRNQKVLSVARRAKLLIFDFSGPLAMLVHLKMTGQFIFEDKKLREQTGGKYRVINKAAAPLISLPSKHTHVVFNFKDGARLFFNDVRQFGYLKIVMDSDLVNVRDLQEYGMEPFDKEFTFDHFMTIVAKWPKGKIKQILTDPKVVAGIGNIYSDEILFHAKVRPTRTVKSLSDKELQNIYKWIKPVLKKAIEARGSSVGDFIRTDGSWGEMGKFHFVYGRKGQSCKKCRTKIESIKLGGRTGSYCPNCQK